VPAGGLLGLLLVGGLLLSWGTSRAEVPLRSPRIMEVVMPTDVEHERVESVRACAGLNATPVQGLRTLLLSAGGRTVV
jgi:hypothetical protein